MHGSEWLIGFHRIPPAQDDMAIDSEASSEADSDNVKVDDEDTQGKAKPSDKLPTETKTKKATVEDLKVKIEEKEG